MIPAQIIATLESNARSALRSAGDLSPYWISVACLSLACTPVTRDYSTGSAASTGGGGEPLTCPGGYCSTVGKGGYVFTSSDSNTPTGTSYAELATDGTLCMRGSVMALPPNPTDADYANDWGCEMVFNLDQSQGTDTPRNAYTLTGTGVTVNTTAVPSCTTARVVLDQDGAKPTYCALLTPGVEIPWSKFNTKCWNDSGTALSGPPSSQAIRIHFVTGTMACPFTDFCVTAISL
jgi:hypothetical protein